MNEHDSRAPSQEESPIIFCSACGQKNTGDANFCTRCGKQIIANVTDQPLPPISTPPTAPGSERSEQKSSGIVTALAVVGFVFGLIGMLGSFIPLIGIFAIRICVGAAVISGLSVVIALAQNAKRSFPIAALTISLIGVAMIYVQINKFQSATESVRKFTEELQNKPQSQKREQQAKNISGQQINQQTTQQMIINDAFMTSSLDAYNNPIDKKDWFSPGQMTLYYYFSYAGAIQGNTVFYAELLYKGNNIRYGQAIAEYTSGNHSFSFNTDFLPGQYEVRLLSNGHLINNTYFSVIATTAAPPQQPPPPSVLRSEIFHPGDKWEGYYICRQGSTNLELDITDVSGNNIVAIFKFFHPPTGARGTFFLSGMYDPARKYIYFNPGRWIENPNGYVTVGMNGTILDNPTRYEGNINGPGCGPFSVKLVTN